MSALWRSGIWIGIAAFSEMAMIQKLSNCTQWTAPIIAGAVTTLAYRYIQNTFRNDVIDKILLIVLCLCFPLLEVGVLLWWLPLILIVILYKHAYFGLNLRRFGAIKSIIVSLCWLILNVSLFPISLISNQRCLWILISEFLMFLCLTAVNDLFLEATEKTPWKSPVFMRLWMVICGLLSAVLLNITTTTFQITICLTATIPFALTLLLWRKQYTRNSMRFYWVDGAIILRAWIMFFIAA